LGRLVVISIFSFFLVSPLLSQEMAITVKTMVGMGYQLDDQLIYDPGMNGGGIGIERIHRFSSSRMGLLTGAEYNFNGWGSHAYFTNGLNYTILRNRFFDLMAQGLLMNGVVLLKPKPAYTGAIEIGLQSNFRISQKIALYLFTGFRYSASPSYKKTGPIWAYSDIPIGVGICIK